MTPVSEYRGLSEADKEWVRKFNVEVTASNKVEKPLFNATQRRESYRRKYHRMHDAMLQAHYQEPLDGHDPANEVVALIDRHHRLQRIISKKK